MAFSQRLGADFYAKIQTEIRKRMATPASICCFSIPMTT